VPGTSDATIQVTETSYDYAATEEVWLRQVLAAALPLFDQGVGIAGIIASKSPTLHPQGQQYEVHRMEMLSGPAEFLNRHHEACRTLDPKHVHSNIKTGFWRLGGSLAAVPHDFERWQKAVGFQDAVGVFALDTDGRGIQLIAPQRRGATLGGGKRHRFQMLAAHLSAGLRLRKAIASSRSRTGDEPDALPLGAQAVVDPASFDVTDAVKGVQDSDTLQSFRQAAVRTDRARGRLRKQDPDEALATWRALVSGRWSMVDWFDTDQRRYVLALPNPPRVVDPRGLTQREGQVVAYASLGESHKVIAYRLGLSRSTVTNALRAAMRKLGVRTQAQLVERLRGAPTEANGAQSS
jgi:DNA-binding CsgD family transcriptional regulator